MKNHSRAAGEVSPQPAFVVVGEDTNNGIVGGYANFSYCLTFSLSYNDL
jgi:hypothetical protein